jgi:hypothetical protein
MQDDSKSQLSNTIYNKNKARTNKLIEYIETVSNKDPMSFLPNLESRNQILQKFKDSKAFKNLCNLGMMSKKKNKTSNNSLDNI